MNDASRVFSSTLCLLILALLSALSPVLSLMIADTLSPYLAKIVKHTTSVRCYVWRRLKSALTAA
jgi:hypothetical protein